MVDFRKHMTPEQLARADRASRERTLRWLGTFKAYDERGGEYDKNPHLSPDLEVLCFGGSCSYRFDDRFIKDYIRKLSSFGDADFCFDARGRNHRGVPGVAFDPTTMLKIIDKALERRSELAGQLEFNDRTTVYCCPAEHETTKEKT